MTDSELRSWLLQHAFAKGGRTFNPNWIHKFSKMSEELVAKTSFLSIDATWSVRTTAFLNGQTDVCRCPICLCEVNLHPRSKDPFCSHNCRSVSIEGAPINLDTRDLRSFLLDECFSSDGHRIWSSKLTKYPNRYAELLQKTSFLDGDTPTNMRIRVYLNGQTELNKCMICGKSIQPRRKSPGIYCSNRCIQLSASTQHKFRQTCQRKYGVDYPGQSSVFREKARLTCLDKYGTENPTQSAEVREKTQMTCLSRYGVENVYQSEDVKTKIRSTNLSRYGVEHPGQSKAIMDKSRQTCVDRYGVVHSGQRHMTPDQLRYLADPDWLYDKCIINRIQPTILADELGVGLVTVYRYLAKHNIEPPSGGPSAPEVFLLEWLHSIYPDQIDTSQRDIIGPKELDIYLPNKGLAVEYDGVYWHTEAMGRHKQYHLDKTDACESLGIQLLHIFSTDNLDIWKSVILSKLGLCKRIGARNTIFRMVDNAETHEFLELNHLQGSVRSPIRCGLYHLDELVAIMTFGKPRFNKNYDWELIRFCVKKGYQIIGGASKLLKHSGISNCISYANRRWSNGKLYEAIGFDKVGISAPNYFYTKDGTNIHSRNKFQKHKLSDKLEYFDSSLTESANMKNNGYDRIWDCGNLVYALTK